MNIPERIERLMALSVMLFVSLVCSNVWANSEGEWQPVKSPQDPMEVRTWVKPVAGASIKAFRGEVELPYSWLEVLTILDRIELYPQWVFRCASARRAEGGGLYLNFKGVWPVSDRDVYTRSRVVVDDEVISILTENNEAVIDDHDGFVRIPTLENSFEVIPLASGNTRVVFTTYVDPGGSVPRWLSNFVATSGPLETLQGMRQMLEQYSLGDKATLAELSPMYEPVKAELGGLLCVQSDTVC